MTTDLRILGLFRIYLGGLLLSDLLRRVPYLKLLYSNEGVFPNHAALYNNQGTPLISFFVPFSEPSEVAVAFGIAATVHVLLMVGLWTRWMQVLALVMTVGLNTRNLALEDGGVVSSALLAVFTLFLPLGKRYSLDAVRERWRESPDPAVDARPRGDQEVRSIWMLLVVLQLAVIYVFNTVHKTGATWKSGEAVHWVLWQNRIVTWLAVWFRMHEPSWFSPLASWGTLVVEGSMPVLLLLPWRQKEARLVGLALGVGLHLGIAALMELGPFSYAMIGFWLLVQRGEWLDWLAARRRRFTWNIAYDRRHPGARRLARMLYSLGGPERFVMKASEEETFHVKHRSRERSGVEGVALACRGVAGVGEVLRSLVLGQGRATVERWLAEEQEARPRQPRPRPGSGALWKPLWLAGEVVAVVTGIAIALQISVDNDAIPRRFRREPPGWLAPLVLYPRLLQGWRMFAPDAPTTDGILVVEARTADGRTIDPFTGVAPAMDGVFHGTPRQGVPLCDYGFEIHLERGQGMRRYLRTYLDSLGSLPGQRPGDRLVAYKVWWVEHQSPRPGSTEPSDLSRTLVMSKGEP